MALVNEERLAYLVGKLKTIYNARVNKPEQNPDGTDGQVLQSCGDGTTRWANAVQPSDEQIAEAISDDECHFIITRSSGSGNDFPFFLHTNHLAPGGVDEKAAVIKGLIPAHQGGKLAEAFRITGCHFSYIHKNKTSKIYLL